MPSDSTVFDVSIEPATVNEVLDLRTRILRPHFEPGRLAHFDDDDAPDTLHFVACLNGEVVGCVTYRMARVPETNDEGFQLRGMAVDPSVQKKGVGRRLVDATLPRLARSKPELEWAWCNARESAIAFYEKLGFVEIGAPFTIPGIGPHVVMKKRLPALYA